MITINKDNEPVEWTTYRNTPGATYQAIEPLRTALLNEQGYICAYCNRPIPVTTSENRETSRIEHIQCRDNYPERQLDYTNMVVCCPGFIDGTEHCDKSKKNHNISFTPFSPAVQQSISYGSKEADIKSSNTVWYREMNDILQLNNNLLKKNRNETLNGVRAVLETKKWRKAQIEHKLLAWSNKDNNNKYKAYCGIVIWYLEKKLRQF